MQPMISKYNKIVGFTLMEVMIVVVLIGVIAGFALPNFSRAILKGRVRDAVTQLSSIYAANKIIRARTSSYYVNTTTDLATINTDLDINIVPNGLIYSYVSNDGTTFEATASNASFTVKITDVAIDATIPNPCCDSAANSCGNVAAGGLAACP